MGKYSTKIFRHVDISNLSVESLKNISSEHASPCFFCVLRFSKTGYVIMSAC